MSATVTAAYYYLHPCGRFAYPDDQRLNLSLWPDKYAVGECECGKQAPWERVEGSPPSIPDIRLTGMLGAIIDFLRDGLKHEVPSIREAIHQATGKWRPETSVSAQCRELRDQGYNVVGGYGADGVYCYQLLPGKPVRSERHMRREPRP